MRAEKRAATPEEMAARRALYYAIRADWKRRGVNCTKVADAIAYSDDSVRAYMKALYHGKRGSRFVAAALADWMDKGGVSAAER